MRRRAIAAIALPAIAGMPPGQRPPSAGRASPWRRWRRRRWTGSGGRRRPGPGPGRADRARCSRRSGPPPAQAGASPRCERPAVMASRLARRMFRESISATSARRCRWLLPAATVAQAAPDRRARAPGASGSCCRRSRRSSAIGQRGRVEPYGGRDDRAGPGAAASLVDACDAAAQCGLQFQASAWLFRRRLRFGGESPACAGFRRPRNPDCDRAHRGSAVKAMVTGARRATTRPAVTTVSPARRTTPSSR